MVDEECSIPTSLVESHRSHHDNGPPAQADPRNYVLSMSDYDGKAHAYDVYGECISLVMNVMVTTSHGCLSRCGIGHTRASPAGVGGLSM